MHSAKQCGSFVGAGGALGGATSKNYNSVTFFFLETYVEMNTHGTHNTHKLVALNAVLQEEKYSVYYYCNVLHNTTSPTTCFTTTKVDKIPLTVITLSVTKPRAVTNSKNIAHCQLLVK